MIRDLGIVRPGTTIYIPFHAFDSNDPSASTTISGLATTDIEVYKNGSTTTRSSESGYTLLDTDGIDFNTTTGINGFSISLADNTDAGFWAAGAQYFVVVASITVDAATVNFIPVTFQIGYPDAVINTTIATLSSQTSFTLTVGPAEDDALNGCVVCIHDVASAVQLGFAVVSDYTGSTKTVTLLAGTTFTAAATDNIAIYPPTHANVTRWNGTAVATPTVAGVPEVDVTHWLGTAVATPTTAGVPEVDVTFISGTAQTANDVGDDVNNILSGVNTLTTRLGTPSNLGSGASVAANLSDIEGQTDDIGAAGAGLTAVPWNANWDAEVQSEVTDALNAYDPPTKAETDALLTTALTESYALNGAAPTLSQGIYAIHQMLMQFAISGTTLTVRKLDNTTTAFEVTLDDATAPSSAVRT